MNSTIEHKTVNSSDSVNPLNRVNKSDLETKVKNMYRDVALEPLGTYHFEMGRTLAERLGYSIFTLDRLPAEAIDSFAGVGFYFDLAKLKPGEAVLDLGSGSGMDAFYAALQVGSSGEVHGLDMTRAQLEKARTLSENDDFRNVHFLESYIEQPPIVSSSFDAIISNGVINLSSDKAEVFRQAYRGLKAGGRLAIADIVSNVQLPENITCNANLWAACIGGAVQKDKYLAMILDAGFHLEAIKKNPYSFISNSALGATEDYGIESISILAVKK